jgi:hypothetical protein
MVPMNLNHSSCDILNNLLQDDANQGFITDSDWLSVFLHHCKNDFKGTILNEIIISNHWGLLFNSTYFLFEAFNHKVSQLFESGIAGKIVAKFVSAYQKKSDDDGNVVLTLPHLAWWIWAWLTLMIVASLVFVVEYCMKRVEKRTHCLKAFQ